jgi:hypothetical protein
MAKSKRGPASVPVWATPAWSAWRAAVLALRKHERTCSNCLVDRYCAKGRDLKLAEVTAHRAVTHPGES